MRVNSNSRSVISSPLPGVFTVIEDNFAEYIQLREFVTIYFAGEATQQYFPQYITILLQQTIKEKQCCFSCCLCHFLSNNKPQCLSTISATIISVVFNGPK